MKRQSPKAPLLLLSLVISWRPDASCSETNQQKLDAKTVNALLRDHTAGKATGRLDFQYPLAGTIFPPEIPPPTFVWQDASEGADTWLVAVELQGREKLVGELTRQQEWKPEPELWKSIKRYSRDAEARVTVIGANSAAPGKALSGSSTVIHTSRDEVGALIFYREVPLPFIEAVKNLESIRWRLGDVGSGKPPPVVLDRLPVCGNCHSFSRDGKSLGMDVDYANDKGAYAITAVQKETVLSREKIITWSDYQRDDKQLTFGLLSQLSPDGRYAISTVKDRSVFVPMADLRYSQLFFPVKGILAFYDRETKKFRALPGADNPELVQSNPNWSPDGKYVVFARAKAAKIPGAEQLKDVLLPKHLVRDFIEGKRGFQFDLYRVPFNDGEGGEPEPVPGASHNGMSNYFPRLSPDGKWLVFTQARNFMLLQPDSKLYITPAKGGSPREMTCNTSKMNSWHSWSPNGKWLVFASKARGPYTDLFLTHIDEQGRDSPPVLLENFTSDRRAANIPEFANIRPDAMQRVVEDFLDDVNLLRQAEQLVAYFGLHAKSVYYYRRALKLNPRNMKARVHLGIALASTGKMRDAEQEFLRALKQDPAHAEALNNLASVYARTHRPEQAVKMYTTFLSSQPDNASAHLSLGWTYLAMDKLDQAEERFRQALRLQKNCPKAHLNLGRIAEMRGQREGAITHYRAALEYVPDMTEDHLNVVRTLHNRKELRDPIVRLLDQIVKEKPKYQPARELLKAVTGRRGDP